MIPVNCPDLARGVDYVLDERDAVSRANSAIIVANLNPQGTTNQLVGQMMYRESLREWIIVHALKFPKCR